MLSVPGDTQRPHSGCSRCAGCRPDAFHPILWTAPARRCRLLLLGEPELGAVAAGRDWSTGWT